MTKAEESLKSNERLVPESELKKAQARIKELERVLGRKTMDVEILEEAVRIGREKKLISRTPLRLSSAVIHHVMPCASIVVA
jgi:transposase